jgi:hypothetical protein
MERHLLAPAPVAPVNGATVPPDAAVFRWSGDSGPFSFRLARADRPTEPLVELDGLGSAEVTIADTLPLGPALWWVRAEGGPWSSAVRCLVGELADHAGPDTRAARAPSAAGDEAGQGGQPSVPGNFAKPVWPFAQGPTLHADAPPPDWEAIPGFTDSVASEGIHWDAAPPAPTEPRGGAVVDAASVTLRWTPVPDATGYDVEISPDPSFRRHILRLDAGEATELSLPDLLPATGHRLGWSVRARSPVGATDWSAYGRFYPATEADAHQYRTALDAAIAAERKRREHARAAEQALLDRLPAFERTDTVTQDGVLAGVMVTAGLSLAVLLSFLVIAVFEALAL